MSQRLCRKNKSEIYTLKHISTNDAPFNNHFICILFSLTDCKSSIYSCMPKKRVFPTGRYHIGYVS